MTAIIGIARRLGPWGRRWGWDRVFRKGASFAGPRHPDFVAWARQIVAGRSVLELACGDGSLAAAIARHARFYVGTDVSPEAISLALGRKDTARAYFAVQEMNATIVTKSTDTVIIEEALYYLSPSDQTRLLARCLAHGAKVMVTVHDAVKHAPTLAVCEAAGRIVERHQWGARVGVLIDAR